HQTTDSLDVVACDRWVVRRCRRLVGPACARRRLRHHSCAVEGRTGWPTSDRVVDWEGSGLVHLAKLGNFGWCPRATPDHGWCARSNRRTFYIAGGSWSMGDDQHGRDDGRNNALTVDCDDLHARTDS